MTIAEARNIWPEKVLSIDFPSAVHLEEPRVIEETTKQILKEAAPGDRFIIGITENVLDNRWRESFHTILKMVNKFGKTVNKFGRLPTKVGSTIEIYPQRVGVFHMMCHQESETYRR